MQTKKLLEEFTSVNKKDWLTAIEKHLKGKSANSLDWELEEGIIVSPLHRLEDTKGELLASIKLQKNNAWHLCEKIIVSDYAQANNLALEALQKGASALCFVLKTTPSVSDLDSLLNAIILDLIPIHFEGKSIDWTLLVSYLQNIKDATKLRLSLTTDTSNIEQLANWVKSDTFASFRPLTISIPDSQTASLSQAIYKASLCIDGFLKNGLNPKQIVASFRFEMKSSENYFVEIAKIRAFQKLWLGLMEAYQIQEVHYPFIHVGTQLTSSDNNQYWNMITSTTQAMSAAIAGADSIAVCPSNGLVMADDFSRRIARNVQHLLSEESYLGRVLDPAAGSYYIENLTQQLAVVAWQKFCKM